LSRWQHPFPESTITSRFGVTVRRTNPHRGTDYAPGANALIPAVTDGECVAVQWSDVLGWVMIQAASTGIHYIGYCHLSCNAHGINCQGPSKHTDGSTCMVRLAPGHMLKKGDPAGRIGNTGSASRGAHLHITLSTSLKGVFYGKVYDIAKFINKQLKKKPEVCKCCKRPL
jgi:murein DD-endopeptidase MepM/ murein hydrolase activator NlpD